jgi:DNA modification methylase
MHPTVKPAALVADAIRDCSCRNDIVLDAFMGSGTTIIAAEKTGRKAYGLEIDPGYVDCAVRRYEAYTGKTVLLDETDQTFAEVAAAREACLPQAQTVQAPACETEASTECGDEVSDLKEAAP